MSNRTIIDAKQVDKPMSLSELGTCPFCGMPEVILEGVWICPDCADEVEKE